MVSGRRRRQQDLHLILAALLVVARGKRYRKRHGEQSIV